MQKKTLVALGAFTVLAVLAWLTMRAPEKGTRTGPRPRPVAAFKVGDVKQVDLSGGGKDSVSLKLDGKAWKITAPNAWGADQNTVKNTIEQLEKLSFADIVTESPARFGDMEVSDDKGAHAVVKDGAGKVLFDGWFGKSVGGWTMFRPVGKNEVWQSSGVFKYALARDLAAWRDHTILEFGKEDVTRLEVSSAGQKVSLERIPPADKKDESKWKVLESTVRVDPLDDAVANQMVQQLGTLRAGGFDDKAKPADVGLAPARLTVTAVVKGAPVTLLVGTIKGDDCWVQVAGSPQVYLVQKWTAEKLDQTPINFRDKTLVRAKEADVVALDVSYGGESWSIKHEGATWKLAAGKDATKYVDEGKVKALLSVFDDLKAATFAVGVTAAQAGLDKPAGVVTLHLRDKSVATLKVGALKDESYFVQKVGGAEVMTIKKYTADRFLKKSSDVIKTAAGK